MIPAIANHLWQSTAFALAAALLTLALRKNRARVRHAIWLAASVKFLLPLSILISIGGRIRWQSAPQIAHPALAVVIDRVSQPFTRAVMLPAAIPHAANPFPIILLAIWAVGFLGIAISWFIRWTRLNAIARRAAPLHLGLPIEARSVPEALEPGVFGVFRPVLLLPEGIFNRLTPEQLRAVIAHELIHVRHRDNLAAALQMFIETVFWFHPMIWWMGKRMIEERELACDEEVLRQGSEKRTYAEGILNVCRLYAGSPLPCASGVTGADLKKRIQTILAGCAAREMTFSRKALLAAAALAAVTVPLLTGILHAAAPRPEFEAASVKVHTGNIRGIGARISGSRITFEAFSVANLITWAYQLRSYQVIGGPAWTGSENRWESKTIYDIEAKAEGEETRTPAQFRQMTQAMLADRFHVTLHREKRQMAVYALVIDKGGQKLHESPEPGGLVSDGKKFTATGVSMEILAAQLSNAYGVDRPVMDETGLTGSYDFTLEFGRLDLKGGEFAGPSIFTALKEQLGLRLEPKTAPVEVLVIDSVEKPSAN